MIKICRYNAFFTDFLYILEHNSSYRKIAARISNVLINGNNYDNMLTNILVMR